MLPVIERLLKFLRLEADRGYDNRSVLGGLDRMLEPWQAEARQQGVPEAIVQVVVSRLRDYPQLSPASRQDALRGVRARLRSEYPEIALDAPSVPASRAEPGPEPSTSRQMDVRTLLSPRRRRVNRPQNCLPRTAGRSTSRLPLHPRPNLRALLSSSSCR